MYPPLQPPSCASHIHDRPHISDAGSFHPLLYTWICLLRRALHAHPAAATWTAWLTRHGSDWVRKIESEKENEKENLKDQKSLFPAKCSELLCLPLYRGGRYIALLLTAHLLVTSVLCLCVLSVYHAAVKHETLTQCRAIVGPPSTTLSQH